MVLRIFGAGDCNLIFCLAEDFLAQDSGLNFWILDAPGLSDPAHIESIQEKAQCAMEEYVR